MAITELSPVEICPECFGGKVTYSQIHKRLVTCETCAGRGWAPTVVCRGCGRPAFEFWPKYKQLPLIQYCGKEVCLMKLVEFHAPNQVVKQAVILKHLHGIQQAPVTQHERTVRDWHERLL